MGQTVVISSSAIPVGYCPSSWSAGWGFSVPFLTAELAGNNYSFNFGSTTPAPDDQNKPWFKTDSTTGMPGRWYVFVGGSWVSLNPVPVGAIVMYEGTAASIETYDGGEAGVVTDTTGPMWERVTQLDARFPIGPGTLPSTTVVAVTNTGGEEEHILTRPELPDDRIPTESVIRGNVADGGTAQVYVPDTVSGSFVTNAPLHTEELGDGEGHNNLPPFYSLFFIRRTGRLYYRI